MDQSESVKLRFRKNEPQYILFYYFIFIFYNLTFNYVVWGSKNVTYVTRESAAQALGGWVYKCLQSLLATLS